MAQDFSTTVGVTANGSSGGQRIDFDGAYVQDVSITNNSGATIQYTVDGASWSSVADGTTARPLVKNQALFRLRKSSSDSYPASVEMSWTTADSEPTILKRRGSCREVPYASGAYSVLGTGGSVDVYNGSLAVGGQQNYLITTTTAAANEMGFRYRWTSSGPSVDGNGGFVVPVRVVQVGTTPSAEVKLTISNNIAAGTANVSLIEYCQAGITGWQYLYFPLDKFTSAGTGGQVPNGVLYDFQVQVKNQTAGTAAIVQIGTVYWNAGMRPAVCIGADDGLLSQYTELFPLMQEAGLVGSLAIGMDFVGTTGYMTEAQITEMYDSGWDIVVHGVLSHNDASLTSLALLKAEIQRNQDYIKARWPRAASHYTYIGGAVNNTRSLTALRQLGFKTARLVNRAAPIGLSLGVNAEAWLLMPSNPILDSSVATRLTDLDDIVSGKWVASEIHFHSVAAISPEVAVENTTRANARSIIEKCRDLKALGKIDVLTRTELYSRHSTG